MTTKQHVSDVITEEEYSKWVNKIVFLPCGTGTGKTTFMLKVFIPYLNSLGITKILYLCNRTALKQQIEKDAAEANVKIDVMNYQGIEQILNNKNDSEEIDSRLDYEAFLLDEAQYFLIDSSFNLYTDISFNWIMNHDNITRVFMSATGLDTFRAVCNKLKEKTDSYKDEYIFVRNDNLRTDYSYVQKVNWFYNQAQYKLIIEHINKCKDEKALIFGDSGDKLKKFVDIPNMDEKCDYYYGDKVGKSDFGRNHPKIPRVGDFFTDNKKYLVTTTALDNGVDVKCKKVKHIICDVFDFDTMIQCLGRKRILSDDDTCTFYIMVPDRNKIKRHKDDYAKDLEEISEFESDFEKWEIRDTKDRAKKSKNIYKTIINKKATYQVNRLREAKSKVMKTKLERILDDKFPYYTYKSEIRAVLRLEDSKYGDFQVSPEDNNRDVKALRIFIEKYVDRALTPSRKRMLTMKCGITPNGNAKKSTPKIINEKFREYGITDYELRNDKENEKVNGKWTSVREWKIKKITTEKPR